MALAMYLFESRSLDDALSFLQEHKDDLVHKMSFAQPQDIIESFLYDEPSGDWSIHEEPRDSSVTTEDQLLALAKQGVFCRKRSVIRLYFSLTSVDNLWSMDVVQHPIKFPCLVLEMERISELDRLFRKIPLRLKTYEKDRLQKKIALLQKECSSIQF